MMRNSNSHKPEPNEVNHEPFIQQNVQEEHRLEQKFEQMFLNLKTLHDATIISMRKEMVHLSSHLVTKEELKQLVEVKNSTEADSSAPVTIEMDIVKESASYAKQLINLLEQASFNYVVEKQAKDELYKEYKALKNEFATMKERYDTLAAEKHLAEQDLRQELLEARKKHAKTLERYDELKSAKKQKEYELIEALEKNSTLEKRVPWLEAQLEQQRELVFQKNIAKNSRETINENKEEQE